MAGRQRLAPRRTRAGRRLSPLRSRVAAIAMTTAAIATRTSARRPGEATAARDCEPTGINAAATSCAESKRSAGFFARQRFRSGSEVCGNVVRACGACRADGAHRLDGRVPENARCPVSISYSTAPNENRSERASASCAANLLRRHVAGGAHHIAAIGCRSLIAGRRPSPAWPVRNRESSRRRRS